MSKTETDSASTTAGKGKEFFRRADQVAETGNWDYAIDMYLEGIKREPENVERGHEPLRVVALTRKANGGKGPGMLDGLKLRATKDPLESLVNAERLWSKDPANVTAMMQILKAAESLGLGEVVKWMGPIVLEAQRNLGKPNKRVLLDLAKMLGEQQNFGPAIQACELARKIAPTDGTINKMLNDLMANSAITQGKYTDEEDQGFTKNVKDMEEQARLAQADSMVKDEDYLGKEIQRAKQEYLESPTVPGKINTYVTALLKIEDQEHENQAVDALTRAHKDLGAYQFKLRVGDIRMRQMARRYRELLAAGKKDEAIKQVKRQLAFELEEFGERATNYPTDLEIRFQLGRRQMLAGKYDDAINSFQQAQRNPRRRRRALSYLGQAFAKNKMLPEAAETLSKALEGDVTEEVGKDLRYQLGCVLAEMERYEDAEGMFSHVAQIDYNFKDVRRRLEGVREKMRQQKP